MYSLDQRCIAVELYIKYDLQVNPVVKELGYPSKRILYKWYKKYLERGGHPKIHTKNSPYSYEKKNIAVDYYMNQEISITTIFKLTEPIVKLANEELKRIQSLYEAYITYAITLNEYVLQLKTVQKKLFRPIMSDLQNFYHGSSIYDGYYDKSNMFCVNVLTFVDEQVLYAKDRNKPNLLEWNYDKWMKICSTDYAKYHSEKCKIKH